MARRFYLRPRLLCRLALCVCFTSFCSVVPQSFALESSLTPQILYCFGVPTDLPLSKWRRRHPSYPIVAVVPTVSKPFLKWWAALGRAIYARESEDRD